MKKSDLSSEISMKGEITNQQILQAIQGLDKKIGGLDKKFTGLDQKVGGLDKKVGGLDQKVGDLGNKFTVLDKKVGGLSGQVDKNSKNIKLILLALNDFSNYTEQRFDAVDSRLNIVECNQEDIISRLSNVAYKLEIRDLEKRVGVLEKS